MDKKIIIGGIIGLILLLVLGFMGGQYWYGQDINTQSEELQTENQEEQKVDNTDQATENNQTDEKMPEAGVEVITAGDSGLIVCSDKCGDGICQAGEEKCDNLNCICFEDKQECPQDCK